MSAYRRPDGLDIISLVVLALPVLTLAGMALLAFWRWITG